LRLVGFVHSVKELETLPAKVIGSVTPAIRSRGGGSLGAPTASRGIIRVGSDVQRRGVLANVLDSHKSSVDEPAVSGNILVTIRVNVAHLTTGMADGLGVGLGLPTRVTGALLSEARSRDARGVGTGLIARVFIGTRAILIIVLVVPVLGGISLGRGRGIPRNSSLYRYTGIPRKRKGSNPGKIPIGTKEFIDKIPSEFLCMTQN